MGGALGFADALHLEREAHVLGHRHVWVQSVALEHHGGTAVGRAHVVGTHPVNQQLTAGDGLQTGNHPQGGALATARWADKHQELAVANLQVNALDDLNAAVTLAHAAQLDLAHVNPLWTALTADGVWCCV